VREFVREFVGEIETLLDELRNVTWVIRKMIGSIKKGETPEPELLDHFFNMYNKLVTKSTEIHKIWVIEPYLLTGEPTYESVEEIAIKLIELKNEYEKVVIKYPKADDREKVEMLRLLINAINKYATEIETLLTKLEEEAREKEILT
jgi:CRISPR/Cas system-associated exonuclease Cas4 (RecB family)